MSPKELPMGHYRLAVLTHEALKATRDARNRSRQEEEEREGKQEKGWEGWTVIKKEER